MSFITYCQNKEKYDESFLDSFKKSFKSSYDQSNKDYDKYEDVAKQALAKASDTAKTLSAKTRIPLPLATALIAAGITGGPTAIPFAALLYFVKKPLIKGANRGFDATWDTGAAAVRGARRALGGQTQQQLQPESFRAFVEADSWGDWAGEKLGGAAGTVTGKATRYGSKIASSIGNRAKEISQWAKGNPKEVARMLFLVGTGAAIGAGVGRVAHDIQDFIVQKIKDYGVPQEELSWLRNNIVLDKGEDGIYGTDGEVPLQTGNKDTSAAASKAAETEGSYVDAQDIVSNDRMAMDGATTKNSAGGYGYIQANVKPGEFTGRDPTGVPNQDLGDAYRDMAIVMRGLNNQQQASTLSGWARHLAGIDKTPEDAFVNSLKGLNPDPQDAIEKYGQSAAAEIKKRLASPDNYTTPATIAGGVVGGTGNRKRRN